MSAHTLTPELEKAIKALLGSRPVHWEVAERGFTAAKRGVVKLEDKRSVFVKLAVDTQTAEWIKGETSVYETLKAPFMPHYFGSGSVNEHPFLVIEDLSAAHWPPPWKSPQIDQVFSLLTTLHVTPVPPHLPHLEELRPMRGQWNGIGGWKEVAKKPALFLGLKLCSAEWLNTALPKLIEAEEKAVLTGDDLVHLDIRSDNVCFKKDQVIVVDWNFACRGNGKFDLIGWLPSLYLEGGPAPWEINLEEKGLISLMCGYFASRSPLPPPRPNTTIRTFQYQQLLVALPWACRALKLDIPDELMAKQPTLLQRSS